MKTCTHGRVRGHGLCSVRSQSLGPPVPNFGAAANEAQHSLVGPVPQAAGRVAVVGKSCRRRSGGAHRRPSSPRAVEDGVTEGGDLEADVPAGSAHVRATREPPPCRNLGGGRRGKVHAKDDPAHRIPGDLRSRPRERLDWQLPLSTAILIHTMAR